MASWNNYRFRNAYCSCVYTYDIDVSQPTLPLLEASIKNVVLENICPRHAALNLTPAKLEQFIRSESNVINDAHGAIMAQHPELNDEQADILAKAFSIDDSGQVLLDSQVAPAGAQSLLDSVMGGGKVKLWP